MKSLLVKSTPAMKRRREPVSGVDGPAEASAPSHV